MECYVNQETILNSLVAWQLNHESIIKHQELILSSILGHQTELWRAKVNR